MAPNADAAPAADRFLTIEDVSERVALARPTIYKHIKAGDFPPPVKVTTRASRWRESTINEWMNSRTAA